MPHRLPPLAIILTVAGVLPFLFCGLEAVAANDVTSRLSAYVLTGWGAVILSFLGGVHWGLTLATEDDPAERPRLLFGVAPSLLGLLALAATLYTAQPMFGLVLLIAAFILTVIVEWRGHKRGWVPGGYMGLRVAATIIVVLILTTVTGVRLIGGHLIY